MSPTAAINSDKLSDTPAHVSHFIFALIFCLFLLTPLLGIVCCVVYGWSKRTVHQSSISLLVVLGAVYLGLINSTKVPESDFAVYLEWYSMAADKSLLEYLALFAREPVFYIWMYFISSVTSGSESVFVFVSTFLAYAVILFNVARIGKHFLLSNRIVILIMLCFIFFGPLFSLSAHLMRQFFSAALVLTFYTRWIVYNKRSWWILILALFVHYSAMLFIVLSSIKIPRRLSGPLSLIFAIFYFVFAFVFAKSIASSFSALPVFGLIFTRIASEGGADIGHLSVVAIAFVVLIFFLSIRILLSKIVSENSGLLNASITVVLLAFLVFVANLSDETVEVAKRFYFYEYFFAAIIIPLLFVVSRGFIQGLVWLPFVFITHFFMTIEFGAWQYANLTRLLLLPSWEIWGR